MKKIISLALVLVMCLGVLTACDPSEIIGGILGGKGYDLETAKSYLKNIYIDYLKDNQTPNDFQLVSTLISNGERYTVSWTSDNDAVVIVPSEDGTKVTVDVTRGEEDLTYTLKAVITAPDGTTTDYEMTLVVPRDNTISIADALAAADKTLVTVRGTVIDIGTAWDDSYKNISVTIQDTNGDKLYVYRLSTKVELGDVIVVTGNMATYNNARQVAQGATAVIEGKDPTFVVPEYVECTIPEAIALPDLSLVIVSGTVTKINTAWDSGYKNISVTISDADGNTLYIHRLKTNVTLGDIITVTGKMTTYNGARQIDAGATATITGHDDTVVDPDNGNNGGDQGGDNVGGDNVGGDTPAGSETVTVLVKDYAGANSWTNATLYNTVKLNDYIEVVISSTPVGDWGANSGKYYDGNNTWRVYANETPSIKFTAAEGTTIVSIKVTYILNSDATKAGVLTLNGTNVASEEVVTINASTADFSVADASTKAGQIQITSIEVVYTAGGTVTPNPDPGTGNEPENPGTDSENPGTDPEPDTPATGTYTLVTDLSTLKTGDKILIGNPTNGKLFSAQKTGFYNIGVDYSAEDFSGVADTEIFVVTVNEDGTYSFTSVSGFVIALADSYNSFNEEGANKSWEIIAKDGAEGIYYIKNTVRGNYIEWYADKSNWSSYAASSFSDLFELSLYIYTTTTTNPDDGNNGGNDDTNAEIPASVTFDFSTLTGTGTELTNDTALTTFTGVASSENHTLTSLAVKKIFDGTGLGGAKPSEAGLIKTGTSAENGQLVFTFGAKVVKVEIVCHDFYNAEEKYPTNKTTIAVNGSETQLAPYTEDTTFELAEASNTVTIDVAKRIYISSIVVYFE